MPFLEGGDLVGENLRCHVCIVGAGPAGVAVATALAGSGLDVLVLESGGPFLDRRERGNMITAIGEHARGAQSQTRGRNLGHDYYPLRFSRARGIGGSTAALKDHGLRSRPLDAIDFRGPHGRRWPIAYGDFRPHLGEATRLCGVTEPIDDWVAPGDSSAIGSGHGVMAVEFRHGHRSAIEQAAAALGSGPSQRWVTGATVTRIHVDTGGSVSRVDVGAGAGRFTVQADHFVLAAGGIGNARILLDNDATLEHASGASQVGTGFMEHLHYVAGHLVPTDDRARGTIHDEFCDIGEERWLTVDDSTTLNEGLARSAFIPIPASASSLRPGVRAFGRMLRVLPDGPYGRARWRQDLGDAWRDRRAVASETMGRLRRSGPVEGVFVLGAMSEQIPTSASRVVLSDRKDRLGVRLADLEWSIDEETLRCARRSAEVVGTAFETAGLAEYVPIWADEQSPVFEGGWHHMGTTRMSEDPREGVVDPHGRVHGIANLHVAGSSVFPTGGFANPTLSLVALSLRLGRHLAGDGQV